MNQWQRELDRHASEVAEAQRDRFRTFVPRIAPAPKAIDDRILEEVVRLATEDERRRQAEIALQGIWGVRAKADVDADQRDGGRKFGKAWSEMTIWERLEIASELRETWDLYR